MPGVAQRQGSVRYYCLLVREALGLTWLSHSASRPVSSSCPRHPVLPGYPGLSPPRVPRWVARAAHTWRGRRGAGRVTHREAGPGGSKSAGGSPPRRAPRALSPSAAAQRSASVPGAVPCRSPRESPPLRAQHGAPPGPSLRAPARGGHGDAGRGSAR